MSRFLFAGSGAGVCGARGEVWCHTDYATGRAVVELGFVLLQGVLECWDGVGVLCHSCGARRVSLTDADDSQDVMGGRRGTGTEAQQGSPLSRIINDPCSHSCPTASTSPRSLRMECERHLRNYEHDRGSVHV